MQCGNRISNVIALRRASMAVFEAASRLGDVVAIPAANETFLLLSDPTVVRDQLLPHTD